MQPINNDINLVNNNYNLITAQHVEITDTVSNGVNLTITSNDSTYYANFTEQSNVTKLYRKDKQLCIDKLQYGSYFFIGGELVDHRDSFYKGYIMSDDDLDEVMGYIGVTDNFSLTEIKGLHLVHSGRSKFTTAKFYKKLISAVGEISLFWVWCPFSNNIRYSYKVTTDAGEVIFNKTFHVKKVSIIDVNWISILKTQSDVFLNYITDVVAAKLNEIALEPASLTNMLKVNEIANACNISAIAEATEFKHMAAYYKLTIVGTLLADNAPSHLNKLELWQYVIELLQCDVTECTGELYKLANDLLWS